MVSKDVLKFLKTPDGKIIKGKKYIYIYSGLDKPLSVVTHNFISGGVPN
jgi:hypothetical protein